MEKTLGIEGEIEARFGEVQLTAQTTRDGMPTLWVPAARIVDVLRYVKHEIARPYPTLYDLTAIDERERSHRDGQPHSDFTVVYHLLSYERNTDLRLKVALLGESPSLPSVTSVYPSANWYEREVWDLFGIEFTGHPHMRRILLPPWWTGHPLRKEYPARATERGVFTLPEQVSAQYDEQQIFDPDEFHWERHGEDFDYMVLNWGPSERPRRHSRGVPARRAGDRRRQY